MPYSDWIAFEGSSLLLFGRYNVAERKLQLRFVSGRNYEYLDVPESFWRGLCVADSKGVFFNSHISRAFEFRELASHYGSSPIFIAPDPVRRNSPRPEDFRTSGSCEDARNTYAPPVSKRPTPHQPEVNRREHFSEEQAHELINAGDFLGAVSIYEQLEDEVRREGWGVHPSSEMICYFLYNQVVCLCWSGDYAWAFRRAQKLKDFADHSLDGINSYEFIHSPIDCWVVRRIRAFLDGDEPEPQLRLAVGSLTCFNDGAAKPVFRDVSAQSNGCIMILLAIPAGLIAYFFLMCTTVPPVFYGIFLKELSEI